MKALRSIVLVALLALALAACLAPTGTVASIQSETNAYRAQLGVQSEGWSVNLADSAAGQARYMAAVGVLFHSDLAVVLGKFPDLRTCGENVGVGPASMSGAQMVDAWRASPSHDANLRNPAFSMTGTAVAFGPDGRTWFVAQYCG